MINENGRFGFIMRKSSKTRVVPVILVYSITKTNKQLDFFHFFALTAHYVQIAVIHLCQATHTVIHLLC